MWFHVMPWQFPATKRGTEGRSVEKLRDSTWEEEGATVGSVARNAQFQYIALLGGGNSKILLFSPRSLMILGEMIPMLTHIFQIRLNKPPTRI